MRTRRAGRALLLMGLTVLPGVAGFAMGKGESGYGFLQVPISARGAALGDTMTAVEDEVGAMEYNPAGLTGIDRISINAAHHVYYEKAALQAVSLAYPFYLPALARGRSLAEADTERSNLIIGAQYKQFKANDQARDVVGIPLSEITIRDQLFQVSTAYEMDNFGFGGSFKYMQNKLGVYDRVSTAYDAGVLYHFNKRWTIGASILNLGKGKAFISETDFLPTTGRVGTSYQGKKTLLLFDILRTRDKITQPSLGAEWKVNPVLSLRTGAQYHTSLEVSGGLGLLFSDSGGPKKLTSQSKRENLNVETPSLMNNPKGLATLSEKLQIIALDLIQQYDERETGLKSPTIAILPLESSIEKLGNYSAEILGSVFVKNKNFSVVERSQLNKILQEQKLQQTGITDIQKAVEVGNILSVQLTVLGTIEKLDDKLFITARIVNVKDGKILATSTDELAEKLLIAAPKKQLGANASTGTSKRKAEIGTLGHVDFGLDYAIRNNPLLGLTQTITFKMLY